MNRTNPIIVALDVPTADQSVTLAKELAGEVGAVKVGLQLYNAVGPDIFAKLRANAGKDLRIFYDAKLMDIPNTVAGAVRAAGAHGLWMINVHATGGAAMMRAAVAAAHETTLFPPLVIAVTVLTSISPEALANELGVSETLQDHVVRLARLAQECGCDGVVASPHEIAAIRAACGRDFLIVTPGVRPRGTDHGDQKRVMTPEEAVTAGADHIVVGRAITASLDPLGVTRMIRESLPR
jgi:orotidine-5'-phosphate decarboxylase